MTSSVIAQTGFASMVARFIQRFSAWPVVYPVLRIVFSRKGIASILFIIYQQLENASGDLTLEVMLERVFFVVLAYVVTTALEDVARVNATRRA